MEINLRGPYNSLGYGVTTKNILRELNLLGHSVAFFPIGQVQPESQEEIPVLNECLGRQDTFHSLAPSVSIWHQHSMAEHVGKGHRYGFPIFELDTFTPREIHHLRTLDELFVPSQWALQVVKNNNNTLPCHVVPLGVDSTIFTPQSCTPYTTTRFLHIGKAEVRKGIDIIADLFNSAFSPTDNVELLMAVSNPFLSEEDMQKWIDYYKKTPLGNKISFIPHLQTQQQVAGLMNNVDCGLFPSRAEGWGLETLEMMACGKSVIVTDYSAHTEFCTTSNSYLIPITEMEEAFDGIWFHGGGNWAKFNQQAIDTCIEHMRFIHQKKQSEGTIFNKEGVLTAQRFSWQNSAQALVAGLTNS